MELFIRHWHCILPMMGIALAVFFMREKPKKKNQSNTTVLLDSNKNPFTETAGGD